MNNKGFAITTILYGMLILFLILIVAMLGMLTTYKDRLALLIEDTNGARKIINTSVVPDVEENINPVLEEGMIPVVISNDGTVTTTKVDSDDWYDYSEKKWANAVLVRNSVDLSGKSVATTLGGSLVNEACWKNNGLYFDGTDDFVGLPQINIQTKNAFTVEVEFNVATLSSTQQWLFANVQSGGFGIKITSDKYISFQVYDKDAGAYVYLKSTEKAVVGERYTVTGIYNDGSVSLYVNGEFIVTQPIGTLKNTTNSTIVMLGCDPKGSECIQEEFKGTMYSARFYNKALTETEIKANYENKKAVMDELEFYYDFEDGRNILCDMSGTNVNLNDILAYYVWIPRYKYKIWTDTESSVGSEKIVNIIFEPSKTEDGKDTPMKLSSMVDEWMTHPAFWWDSNSNAKVDEGEMRSGFWVGKFESSVATTSTCYKTPNSTNCNTTGQVPRILPNVKALRYQKISNQFETSLKFAGGDLSETGVVSFVGNNLYGLTSSTDSHVMKNSEWGAVAYLAHSQYGIGGELRNNNTTNFITGCGAEKSNNNTSKSSCEIEYGSREDYPQSTTGNISGIFDMAGGVWESVMSSYNKMLESDGFSSTYFPPKKYYNLYISNNSLNACDGEKCFGHSLFESYKWYDDTSQLVTSSNPWLLRSGSISSNSTYSSKAAGIFVSAPVAGGANVAMGWRSVLITG